MNNIESTFFKINLQMEIAPTDCTHGMKCTVLYYQKFWWTRPMNELLVQKMVLAQQRSHCTDFETIQPLKW